MIGHRMNFGHVVVGALAVLKSDGVTVDHTVILCRNTRDNDGPRFVTGNIYPNQGNTPTEWWAGDYTDDPDTALASLLARAGLANGRRERVTRALYDALSVIMRNPELRNAIEATGDLKAVEQAQAARAAYTLVHGEDGLLPGVQPAKVLEGVQ